MKISLKTDYRDYYDYMFEPCYLKQNSKSYVRMANDPNLSFSKRRQFEYLESFGFKVPRNGLVSDVASATEKNSNL